jgi:hypothetical protein
MKKLLRNSVIFLTALMAILVMGCDNDSTQNDDPTPTPDLRPHSLVESVWAGETPRSGDWLTITFKNLETAIAGSDETGLRVIWSFSVDNSSNNWGYTYDSSTGIGTVISSGWNPAPDGFSISADGKTLTITHYGNHEGGLVSSIGCGLLI